MGDLTTDICSTLISPRVNDSKSANAFHRDPRSNCFSRMTMIGVPSLYVVLCACQTPPGAPLRNGSTVIRNSSPGLSVWLDQPSHLRLLVLSPSRFHVTGGASWPATSNAMNA